jgi:hypothetical protein
MANAVSWTQRTYGQLECREVGPDVCPVCGKAVTQRTMSVQSSDGLVHLACLESKEQSCEPSTV